MKVRKMKAIEKFLNKEEKGWEKSIVDYAPEGADTRVFSLIRK